MKTTILFCALIFIIGFGSLQQRTEAQQNNTENVHNIASGATVKDSFDNLKEALLNPDKVVILSLNSNYHYIKHLSAQIGTLSHLKVLRIGCLENLEELPQEIGELKSLEKLIIDNGNGCAMNVGIPSTIGQLTNLKKLTLFGALDYRDEWGKPDTSKIKKLPSTLANLPNLEELDLGRNGLLTIPDVVWSLKKLKILKLDFNDFKEIPSSILNLTHLMVLSVSCNYHLKLPDCLNEMKGLQVHINEFYPLGPYTKQEQQSEHKKEEELKKRFPDIIFTFEECD